MKVFLAFFATTAMASAFYNEAARPNLVGRAIEAAQPLPRVPDPRLVQPGLLPTDVIPIHLTLPLTTPKPTPAAAANPKCTPLTLCVDAITCGLRYGGCYDKNFCTGTTSYPVPTVTCAPGAGRGGT